MSTKAKGKTSKGRGEKSTANQEGATAGDASPIKVHQMEEKQIETVIQQLMALNIRKRAPQGAEAIAKGGEEAVAEAAGGSPSSPTAQGPDSSRGNARRRKDKRKYDGQGRLLSNGLDLCDCLNEGCPGCFSPCPKCSSKKCRIKCRCNRHWVYRKNDNESDDPVSTNPFSYTK